MVEKLGPQEIPFQIFANIALSYGVEVWGIGIPKSTWKEFENVQKHFLRKFIKVTLQTSYTLLFLETKPLPTKITPMGRVVKYMLKVQKSPLCRLPRITLNVTKKIQKTYKSKTLYSILVQNLEDGMQPLASWYINRFSVNEVLSQDQSIMIYGKNTITRTSYIMLHILHLPAKAYSSPREALPPWRMCLIYPLISMLLGPIVEIQDLWVVSYLWIAGGSSLLSMGLQVY